ncbi:hypothetical protein DWW90_03780 [Parabacteroides sp. AF17-28]|nr:hypothetical protein DWW90_03780 [Parabacteroides sp. AF17-28]
MSPRLTRGRNRTGLINQLFIRSVLMRSRVKRGNRAVLTHFKILSEDDARFLFALHLLYIN